MKTKELIEFVNQHEGLYVKEQGELLTFYEEGMGRPYFILSKMASHWSDGSSSLEYVKKVSIDALLDVGDHIVGYLSTPCDQREEKKQYYLRLANTMFKDKRKLYLNQDVYTPETYYLDSNKQEDGMKTIFTQSEIDQMDITGFEPEEVKE